MARGQCYCCAEERSLGDCQTCGAPLCERCQREHRQDLEQRDRAEREALEERKVLEKAREPWRF